MLIFFIFFRLAVHGHQSDMIYTRNCFEVTVRQDFFLIGASFTFHSSSYLGQSLGNALKKFSSSTQLIQKYSR